MARTDTLGNFLTDVADAIREKKGTTDTIPASDFDTEIASIESGDNINEYLGNPSKYKTLAPSDTGYYVGTNSYNKVCQNITKLIGPIRFINTVSDTYSYTFAYMPMIEEIPDITYIFAHNLSHFFYSDMKLKRVPYIQCLDGSMEKSLVTNVSAFCYGCKELIEVPLLNLYSATYIEDMFKLCSSLTTLGGFKDLGQAYDTTKDANYTYYTLDLSSSTLLTEQSMINVLTNLYDIATKGVKPQQVILGATNLAKLTSTEGQQALAQAQQFGWNIA